MTTTRSGPLSVRFDSNLNWKQEEEKSIKGPVFRKNINKSYKREELTDPVRDQKMSAFLAKVESDPNHPGCNLLPRAGGAKTHLDLIVSLAVTSSYVDGTGKSQFAIVREALAPDSYTRSFTLPLVEKWIEETEAGT
jgi:hypothetical protein